MRRAALLGAGLVLTLAACGGTRDDTTEPALGAPGTPPASAAAAAPSSPPPASAPTSAPAPSAPAAPPPASARTCPVTPRPAPAPPGSTTDLKVKPVIKAGTTPPPSEVTVADIVPGTGPEATTLSAVSVKYVGALYPTGVEFDSSWSKSPQQTIDFTVCGTEVIPGFAIAPTGMRVGGRRLVTIPPTYGYQDKAQGDKIPANSTLVFVIDLVKVTPPAGG